MSSFSLPGIDDIYTSFSSQDEMAILGAAEYASGENGAMAELFALGPVDMSYAKKRCMIYLAAALKIDHYVLAISHMDMRGNMLVKDYFNTFSADQPDFVGMKLLDIDRIDDPIIVAAALVIYGIAFIIIERLKKGKIFAVISADDISYRTALYIGLFQVLSIVPGTSRSGSTILGAMLCGVSRTAAAEFTFFLAIPAMCGASGLEVLSYAKDIKDGIAPMINGHQIAVLAVAMVISFAISLICIKFLMGFVKRHSFESFGWYRIALGAILLVYFLIIA